MILGLPRAALEDELVALDTEFYGQQEGKLHRPHGMFACITVSYGDDETYLVDDVHDVLEVLNRIAAGRWALHNAVYDLRQLRQLVPIDRRSIWDTMLVDKGLFPGWYDSFGLADLSRRWLKRPMSKSVRNLFATQKYMTDEMREYAAVDAAATLDIAYEQQMHIERNNLPMDHYWNADEPCIWAVLDMPPARIDVDGWLKLAEYHESEGKRIESELGLNVRSSPQVTEALRKRDMRVRSTNKKDTLIPLERRLRLEGKSEDADFIKTILDCRMMLKAASTYGRSWVDEHVELGGLVYGDYHIVGARSTRMACSHPNMQQIPTRDLPIFRKLFISRHEGGRILVADAWQQEVCILAWFSEDENLRNALLERRDLHQETADDFGLTRREGKDINLGLGYGMSAAGLASRVGVSLVEAQRGIERRNRRYPMVKSWSERQQRQAIAEDFVTASMGNRLWVNKYDRQWQRHAINLPIQGTAALHTKIWFTMVHELSKELGEEFLVPLVVHDELVMDCPPEKVAFWERMLPELGSRAGAAAVPGFPMTCNATAGDSWAVK